MQVIQVIDPANLTVVANITRDQYGDALVNTAEGRNVSRAWNDGLYIQVPPSPGS